MKKLRILFTTAVLTATLGGLSAKTIMWDGGPSPYAGNNWNDDVNWVGDIKPATGDTASFSANGNTGLVEGKVISLGAPQVIDTLNLNPQWSIVPTITIGSRADVAAGNTLTVTTVKHEGPNTGSVQTIAADVILIADSIWDIMQGYGGNNTHIVVSGIINGSGKALTKINNGLLKLCGVNTYTGITTISAGSLEVGNGTQTGSIAGDIVNNAALTFNPGPQGVVTSTNISGTGSLTKSGAGTWVLAGSTSAASSGSFTITGGALDTTLPSLVLNNSSYAWNGDFTYIGTEDLTLGTAGVSLNADRIVTVQAKTLKVNGIISGGRKLTKNGDGTLELTAANTYSSGTVVNTGTLNLNGAGTAGTSFLTINNAGTVLLDNTSANANRIGDSSAVTLTGTLNVIGNGTEATSETAGALTHGAGAANITVSSGSGQSALLTFASLASRNTGFSALYRGTSLGASFGADTSNIKFTTTPTVSKYGAFAASDGTGTPGTVNAAILRGVLFDDSASGLGKGFATYGDNGVRLLDSGTEQTGTYAAGTANIRLDLAADVAITGDTSSTLQLDNTSGSAKTVTNSGNALIPQNGLLFSGTDAITLTGGTLDSNIDTNNAETIILSCNTAGTILGTAIKGNNITLGGTGDMTLAAALTPKSYANGYIRVNTLGTVTLSATANGALIINQGIVKLATGGKLYEADSFSSADRCYLTINRLGTLNLNGISAKSNGINGSGAITNGSETLATLTGDWQPTGINYFTYAPDFSGNIGGNISLVITGGGFYIYNYTQRLSGNNTFTGGVTVNNSGMTLSINSPTAIGTGPLTIKGGNLNSNGQILTTANSQNWNSSFTFKGSADLNMGNGPVTLGTANPTITVSANTLTIGGAITESTAGSTVTKAGAGTLVLNGENAYTGITTVNAGNLAVGGRLGSGNVFVANGAKLTLNGNDVIGDKRILNVASNGVVVLNGTVKETVRQLVLNGVIQPPVATYGAIGSGAVFEIANYFAGTGLLAFPPEATLFVIR